MEFQLAQGVLILERTPQILNTLLRDLPTEWTEGNEGGASWSPFDVIGHLIHCEETDWIPRARIILEHGEGRAFEPFDRFAQFEKSVGWTLHELLDRFANLRAANLDVLRSWNCTPEQLGKRGMHPELGSVTLSQLLATWVVHDLGHLAQISRTMVKQYRGAVGPWTAYMSLLREA